MCPCKIGWDAKDREGRREKGGKQGGDRCGRDVEGSGIVTQKGA